jgi:hypothetical protein
MEQFLTPVEQRPIPIYHTMKFEKCPESTVLTTFGLGKIEVDMDMDMDMDSLFSSQNFVAECFKQDDVDFWKLGRREREKRKGRRALNQWVYHVLLRLAEGSTKSRRRPHFSI